MNRVTVLSLISQADLLAGHEVCAPVVNDAAVNNGQLVPILSGGDVRMEPTRSDRSEKKTLRGDVLSGRDAVTDVTIFDNVFATRNTWASGDDCGARINKSIERLARRKAYGRQWRQRRESGRTWSGGGKEGVEAKNERTVGSLRLRDGGGRG